MTKRIFLIVALSVLVAGMVFSQEEETEQGGQVEQTKQTMWPDFAEMPKNTITVDIGPTIVGLGIGAVGNLLGGDTGLSSTGFGIGVQYERQLAQKFSVALRFAYLGGGIGFSNNSDQSDTNVKTSLGLNMSSFSIEGHARLYPTGKIFFLDGMMGYANMALNISGTMEGTTTENGVEVKKEVSANMDASQDFFKLGVKLGWRISGTKGGFTFEPALGYSFGLSSGDKIGDQLAKKIKEQSGADIPTDSFNMMFDMIQNIIFVGGPRMTLAFGWRF